MTTIDYKTETEEVLNRLIAAGFQILWVDNGEDRTKWDEDKRAEFVAEAMACDEAWLKVACGKTGSKLTLYLVYGNGAGELVCDWTSHEGLNAVMDAFYDAHNE